MEKDEKLKLVGENGETILMTKSEYLNLAKQKGWNIKIPQLKDGTYDCDVFGDDDVHFGFGFFIAGTLYLKDNARLDDDVSTCDITGRNVICGDNLEAGWCSVSATNGFAIFGKNAHVHDGDDDDDDGYVSATEDFLCDDEPTA